MEPVSFDDTETYEPKDGWRRVSMTGSDAFSFEWFEKPPGHSSLMHDPEKEQVCLCLEGELTLYTEDREVTLEQYDSARLESWEPHRVANGGDDLAVRLDVFGPRLWLRLLDRPGRLTAIDPGPGRRSLPVGAVRRER